jgi:hypothetical protein
VLHADHHGVAQLDVGRGETTDTDVARDLGALLAVVPLVNATWVSPIGVSERSEARSAPVRLTSTLRGTPVSFTFSFSAPRTTLTDADVIVLEPV